MAQDDHWTGRGVAITGGAGSIGRAVARKLVAMGVRHLRIVDTNEAQLFDMEQALLPAPEVDFRCCDVADEAGLTECFDGMDTVFHLAALKHVPICERSPGSAVNTNIRGTESVIRAATRAGVGRVLFTSSDKAVNPTNVMGTSKLMGERLLTAAAAAASDGRPVFASTRFGNVAGTRGSVIPLFAEQIARGGPVTLTDARMTRFVMTQARAADLVIDSIRHARGGEVFVTKMPVLNVADLARVMVGMLAPLHGHDPAGIEIREIGSRPGEKLWEELSTDEETARTYEGEDYIVVRPPTDRIPADVARLLYPDLGLAPSAAPYHSERADRMTDAEIADFLMQPDVLDPAVQGRLASAVTPMLRAV